jgi:hypothetical protein
MGRDLFAAPVTHDDHNLPRTAKSSTVDTVGSLAYGHVTKC